MEQTSPAVQEQKEREKPTPEQQLNEHEKAQHRILLQRLQDARDQREQPHRTMDGMTYLQDYQANEDAALTFLEPKKNDNDVRINTPTSEKKLEVIVNELYSLNLQPEINAHDSQDAEIVYLGKDMEHMVLRTNRIEKEDDVILDIYRELVSQRTVFIKERFVERTTRGPNNQLTTRRYAEKVLVPGTKVYAGNIYLPAYKFHEQPYYFEYERMPYATAKALFAHNPLTKDRWKHVKQGGTMSNVVPESDLYDFRLHNLNPDEVEVIYYKSLPDNEYQIIINGVVMLPLGTPLPFEHSDMYDMIAVSIKPTKSRFLYGKSPLSSAKTLQAFENETIRNLIRKFRQALEPPMGTTEKQIFSRRIWDPASITQGINKNTFNKLIEHDGVTQSEMAMYDKITQQTEAFIGVADIMQGGAVADRQTATTTLEQVNRAIKMMGLAVAAAMRIRRDCTYLRVYNILENFTKPVGKKLEHETNEIINKYMQFTINDVQLENGRRGTKVIKMMERNITPEESQAIYDEEERQRALGKEVKIRTINAKALREVTIFWYVTSVQREREGSQLSKLMNQEKLNQVFAVQQASQGQVQGDYQSLSEELELSWGSKNMFLRGPNQQQRMSPNPEVEQKANEMLSKLDELSGQSGLGAQLTEPIQGQARLPDMAQMANAQ